MSVVFISREVDAHLPFVAKHLHEKPIIVDPAQVLRGHEFSYYYANGAVEFLLNGKPLRNISGVWLRRPGDFQIPSLPIEQHLQEYTLSIQKEFMSLLYTHFPEALWISDYHAIKRASSKTLQLVTARKLGLNVPRTLFTSSSEEARAFVTSCKKGAVAKALPNAGFKNRLMSGKSYV